MDFFIFVMISFQKFEIFTALKILIVLWVMTPSSRCIFVLHACSVTELQQCDCLVLLCIPLWCL
jgi:hypothetical protein